MILLMNLEELLRHFMFVLQMLKLEDQQLLGEATCLLSEVLAVHLFTFLILSQLIGPSTSENEISIIV